MSATERRRGAVYEREVLAAIRAAGLEARRNLQYQHDHGLPDILIEDPMIAVECKRTNRLSLHAAMAQAEAGCERSGGYPVVVSRRDNDTSIVHLRLEHFLAIIGREADNG